VFRRFILPHIALQPYITLPILFLSNAEGTSVPNAYPRCVYTPPTRTIFSISLKCFILNCSLCRLTTGSELDIAYEPPFLCGGRHRFVQSYPLTLFDVILDISIYFTWLFFGRLLGPARRLVLLYCTLPLCRLNFSGVARNFSQGVRNSVVFSSERQRSLLMRTLHEIIRWTLTTNAVRCHQRICHGPLVWPRPAHVGWTSVAGRERNSWVTGERVITCRTSSMETSRKLQSCRTHDEHTTAAAAAARSPSTFSWKNSASSSELMSVEANTGLCKWQTDENNHSS